MSLTTDLSFTRAVCVIPARGGSKRIPKKNIRTFCGKPIISWAIEAALHSGCFERVIVSTDSSEVATIAKHYGAEAPFLRPSYLSDDYTVTHDVVLHAIEWMRQTSTHCPSVICCLYPTAAMVSAEDLAVSAKHLLATPSEGYVFAATTFPFPIERAILLDDLGNSRLVYPQYLHTRSQDLNQAYHDAGQFYWGRIQAWLNNPNVFDSSKAYVLPRWKALDIDTEEDWVHAEHLFHAIRLHK